jgi:hypothetical protein
MFHSNLAKKRNFSVFNNIIRIKGGLEKFLSEFRASLRHPKVGGNI